jgi:serine protease Do
MPADLVMRAVTEIESGRPPELARGFLGVRTFRRVVSASDSLWHGIGVIVSEVLDGGPAQRYGIRPGDVILRFGDTPVEDANQLTRLVGQARPGAAVQLEILRAGSPQRVQVNLGDAMIGQAALAHRRELDFERSQLRREVLQLEERLNLLRRRLETLEPGEERDRVRGPGDSSRD